MSRTPVFKRKLNEALNRLNHETPRITRSNEKHLMERLGSTEVTLSIPNESVTLYISHGCPKCGDDLQITVTPNREYTVGCVRCEEGYTELKP